MHSYDNVSRRLKSASTKFAPDVNHLRCGEVMLCREVKLCGEVKLYGKVKLCREVKFCCEVKLCVSKIGVSLVVYGVFPPKGSLLTSEVTLELGTRGVE
ncbi:hypothetical protein Tco_0276029 [Tanacetum coccineum]